MRKRRRLADKLTIIVCAVLVAVSAFFYVPMDVNAEVIGHTGSWNKDIFYTEGVDSVPFNFSSYLNDGVGLYVVEFDVNSNWFCDTHFFWWRHLTTYFNVSGFEYSTYNFGPEWIEGVSGQIMNYTYTSHMKIIVDSDSPVCTVSYKGVPDGDSELRDIVYTLSYNIFNVSAVKLSSSDSNDYQNGYNAGYSAGETAGYGNGYSQGFTDGEASVDTDAIYDEAFQAGKDSVDTESYYDAGYQAGYQVAYSEGYESGYDDGLKSARESKGEWGVQKNLEGDGEILSGIPFYVSTYGITDLEISDNDAFYFYNTSPGTYHGKSEILYKMPVSSMNSPYGALVSDSGVTNVSFILPSLNLDIVVDSAGGTVSSNLVSGRLVECFVTYSGKKYYGVIGSNYVNFDFVIDEPVDQLLFSDSNFLITFVVDSSVVVVTKSDVSEYVVPKYTPKISFSDFNFFIKPYYMNDNVSANIQDQTNSLTNGFNDSKGNSLNSDFSSGLNDFETAEDSLFATATTGLKDFTFFDFQSVPAMVTGMSFVGSIMSGWFTHAGGASGVGIVLSILFSIMLVAMVLGLYRWYQSKGGKD